MIARPRLLRVQLFAGQLLALAPVLARFTARVLQVYVGLHRGLREAWHAADHWQPRTRMVAEPSGWERHRPSTLADVIRTESPGDAIVAPGEWHDLGETEPAHLPGCTLCGAPPGEQHQEGCPW